MKPELDEPFAERVDRLARELELAIRWDRPSILLAVYSSEFVRADAEAALEAWLHEQGQEMARIQVTKPADADVPLRLREWPDRDRTVFFVSGLRRGEPTSWNALNVRREYLVEDRIRAVFWLTEGEATELARRAPDFWAFRHRTVEFVEPPEVGRAVRTARELTWMGFEEKISPEERRARIAFRKQLLSELPDSPETAAARADLHYTLGGLFYFERDYRAALEHLQVALELAQQTGDAQLLQSWIHNSLGNVYADLGRHEDAIAEYQKAIKLDPDDAYPHNGLGNVYRDLGRHEEAIAEFQQAIELDPSLAYLHNNLGAVYRDLGRQEEAISAFQRAIELDPTYAYPHNGLGNVYRDLGRHEEAITEYQKAIELGGLNDHELAVVHNNLVAVYRDLGRQEEAIAEYRRVIELGGLNDHELAVVHNGLGNVYRDLGRQKEAIVAYQSAIELDPTDAVLQSSFAAACREMGREEEYETHIRRARELMANESEYNKACIESIAGNVDVALEHLAKALEKAPGLRTWARRDPDFAFIRDEPRFRELVGEYLG